MRVPRTRGEVVAVVRRLRPRWPRTRTGWRRTVQAAAALCTLALLPATWVHLAGEGRVRALADVPAEPVGVVFGAGLSRRGGPRRIWRTG